MIGDRRGIRADAMGNHDPSFACRLQVNPLESRTLRTNDFQVGHCIEKRPTEPVRAFCLHGANTLEQRILQQSVMGFLIGTVMDFVCFS
jgi:hypothetical protein